MSDTEAGFIKDLTEGASLQATSNIRVGGNPGRPEEPQLPAGLGEPIPDPASGRIMLVQHVLGLSAHPAVTVNFNLQTDKTDGQIVNKVLEGLFNHSRVKRFSTEIQFAGSNFWLHIPRAAFDHKQS